MWFPDFSIGQRTEHTSLLEILLPKMAVDGWMAPLNFGKDFFPCQRTPWANETKKKVVMREHLCFVAGTE